MEEALRHLARLGLSPSAVVDVGTATGTHDLLRVFPNSQYLWIEPLREFEPDLKRLAAGYSGEYLIRACGSRSGDVIMHVHPDLTGSSILRETEGEHADGVPRQVPMCRLDDLLEERHLEGDLVLKVDVQGAELDVLEGGWAPVIALRGCDFGGFTLSLHEDKPGIARGPRLHAAEGLRSL